MWYIVALAACVAGDQLLKWWVVSHLEVGQSAPLLPGVVQLTRLHNTGAAWSSFSGKTGLLAIVTIVTERYRTQYALIYTTRISEAVADKEIQLQERDAYNNPTVSMSTADMVRFARRVWNSPAKIRNVATKAHRMVMRLNNIYSVGDYFFIDFSIENKTNIRFDIDEIRVKLSDKKLSKATNAQTIELTPALVLEHGKTFKHGYRNVIVVKKMTFPNDKLLTIEMTEQQISGRNISLNIDYEDVLSADSFNTALLEEE